MELTKSKLNKILKKYRLKLKQLDNEWEFICSKKCRTEVDGDKLNVYMPTIYDHQKHTSKGHQLFKDLMAEFEDYEVFPKKNRA